MTFHNGERTARDWVIANKDKIGYVILDYIVCEPMEAESGLIGVHKDGKGYDMLYHLFDVRRLDSEYSYAGYVDNCIDFLNSYCVWDGIIEEEATIKNGLLYCQHVNDIQYYENWIGDYDPNEIYLESHHRGLHNYRNNKPRHIDKNEYSKIVPWEQRPREEELREEE